MRGLDYYTRTVFEVVAEGLGAQDAVAGGGRYNGLSQQLGGPYLPALGFAIGQDRLLEILAWDLARRDREYKVFLVALGEAAKEKCLNLLQKLRESQPGHGNGFWQPVAKGPDVPGRPFGGSLRYYHRRNGVKRREGASPGHGGRPAADRSD